MFRYNSHLYDTFRCLLYSVTFLRFSSGSELRWFPKHQGTFTTWNCPSPQVSLFWRFYTVLFMTLIINIVGLRSFNQRFVSSVVIFISTCSSSWVSSPALLRGRLLRALYNHIFRFWLHIEVLEELLRDDSFPTFQLKL